MNALTYYLTKYLYVSLFLATVFLALAPCITYASFMNTGAGVSVLMQQSDEIIIFAELIIY